VFSPEVRLLALPINTKLRLVWLIGKNTSLLYYGINYCCKNSRIGKFAKLDSLLLMEKCQKIEKSLQLQLENFFFLEKERKKDKKKFSGIHFKTKK
jgi:hypothetical protein